MEKYETPIIEVIDFGNRVDTIVESAIDKDDENKEMIYPTF